MWSAFDPSAYNASHDFLQMLMWRNVQPQRPMTSAVSPNQVYPNFEQDGVLQKQLCANSLLHQALSILTKKTEAEQTTENLHSIIGPSDGTFTSGSDSPPSFPNLSTESWLPHYTAMLPPNPPVPPSRSQPPTHRSADAETSHHPPIDLSTEKPPKYDKFSITDLLSSNSPETTKNTVHHHPHACFECVYCGRSYATKTGLQRHQNQCSNMRVSLPDGGSPDSFQENCIDSTSAMASSNSRQYTCNVCTKIYISMSALKMHIRTHTLPCKCHVCGKAFSRMWLLNGHLRTHTGEKPFGCRVCTRAFADRSNLRAHMQTHSEVKRYRCDDCGKTFSRMGLLTRHNRAGCNSLGEQNNSQSPDATPSETVSGTTTPAPSRPTSKSKTNTPVRNHQPHQMWPVNSVFS